MELRKICLKKQPGYKSGSGGATVQKLQHFYNVKMVENKTFGNRKVEAYPSYSSYYYYVDSKYTSSTANPELSRILFM